MWWEAEQSKRGSRFKFSVYNGCECGSGLQKATQGHSQRRRDAERASRPEASGGDGRTPEHNQLTHGSKETET